MSRGIRLADLGLPAAAPLRPQMQVSAHRLGNRRGKLQCQSANADLSPSTERVRDDEVCEDKTSPALTDAPGSSSG
jgi:hypothetical protein